MNQQTLQERMETYEKLLKIMSCIRCGDFCPPPYQQCESGHIICVFCRGTLSCICGEYGTPFRVLVFDTIHEMMKFPCRFRKFGCNFKGKYDALRKHRVVCSLNASFCPVPVPKCSWKGESMDIFEHFTNCHTDEPGVKVMPNQIKIRMDHEVKFIIEQMGVIFLIVFAVHPRSVKCYATNFDHSYKHIQRFDVHFLCEPKGKASHEGQIQCFSRVNKNFQWKTLDVEEERWYNADFKFTVKPTDRHSVN